MGQLGEWGTHNSNGFGSLTLPIFNAGSLMAQVEQRDAQAAQAKIDYEASLLAGVQDVEDALNKVWSQETRKKSLVVAEESARKRSDSRTAELQCRSSRLYGRADDPKNAFDCSGIFGECGG